MEPPKIVQSPDPLKPRIANAASRFWALVWGLGFLVLAYVLIRFLVVGWPHETAILVLAVAHVVLFLAGGVAFVLACVTGRIPEFVREWLDSRGD